MQTCPECGNHDMTTRSVAGAMVHECGLCGARFGERDSVRDAHLVEEADTQGVDPDIWPLARVLRDLPGLSLGASAPGGTRAAPLPEVELLVTGHEALLQVENLCKALRLCAGQLRCRWMLEARFEQTLVFVLRPGGPNRELRDARIDVPVLAAVLERDQRLGWWRRDASDEQNG